MIGWASDSGHRSDLEAARNVSPRLVSGSVEGSKSYNPADSCGIICILVLYSTYASKNDDEQQSSLNYQYKGIVASRVSAST